MRGPILNTISLTEEANNIVANLEGLADRRSIVLYNEEWHKGVIGIVASRLTEVYYRPAVVLTRTDDMATGSARSVSGFVVEQIERRSANPSRLERCCLLPPSYSCRGLSGFRCTG